MSSFDEFVDNLPEPEKKQSKSNGAFSGDWSYQDAMDLAKEVISAGTLNVMREGLKGADYYFNLKECVFDSSHKNNDAAIIVKQDGTLCYHCFHNSCADQSWADVRALVAPKPTRQENRKAIVRKKTTTEPSSIINALVSLYDNGLASGLTTGWESLDNCYTVMLGQWTIVTGIPSHGKSSFLDALLVNLAKEHGFKTAVFSPENHPIQVHCSKLVETVTGEPFYETYSRIKMEKSTMLKAATFVEDYFKFVTHGDEILCLDDILASTKTLIENYNIKGLVIDPWNEINHKMGGESETIYISKALTKIRSFARKHNIHIWIVAHPTKLRKNEKGDYDPPTPYDIAGSAHFRNKSDCAITVHRPSFAPNNYDVDVHVQKIRFKHVGKTGKIGFVFNLTNNRYAERSSFV